MTLANAFRNFVEFLAKLLRSLLIASLLALPWLMRAAELIGWLTAAWYGMNTVQEIYAPFTQPVPLMALQIALVLAQVSWLGSLLLIAREQVWGGMAAGAMAIAGLSRLALNLQSREYGELVFRLLPPALFAVLLIYLTVRLRPAVRMAAEKGE